METKKAIRIIAGAPPSDPAIEEEWHKWLDEEHILNMFKYPGIKRITNYELVDEAKSEYTTGFEYPRYISIFELESPEEWEKWIASPEHTVARDNGLEKWGPNVGYKKIWYALYKATKILER